MTNRWTIALAGLGLLLLAGCPKKTPAESPAPTDEPPADAAPTDQPADRPSLTSAECEAQGGVIVGDIGDGAIHRPDYRCEDGQPPLGTIRPEGDEPVAIEGAVCCSTAP